MISVSRPIGQSLWGSESPARKGPVPTILPPGFDREVMRERQRQGDIDAVLLEYGNEFEGYLALEQDLYRQDLQTENFVHAYIRDEELQVIDKEAVANVSYYHAYGSYVTDVHNSDGEPNLELRRAAGSLVDGRQTLEVWQQLFADRDAKRPQTLPIEGSRFVYKTTEGVASDEVIATAREAVERMDSEKIFDGLRAGRALRALGKMVVAETGPDYDIGAMEDGPLVRMGLARAIVKGANNEEVTEEQQ